MRSRHPQPVIPRACGDGRRVESEPGAGVGVRRSLNRRCSSTSSSACWACCRRCCSSPLLVFLFVHLLPGDPARLAAGPDATPETVELVRKDLGLDQPLPEQFVRFVGGALRWDFGTVAAHQAPGVRPKSPSASCRRSGSRSGAWLWSVTIGMAHRHRVGRLAQSLARPRRHDAGGVGHLVPGVRAGHGADAGVRGAARLAAHRRQRHAGAATSCRR